MVVPTGPRAERVSTANDPFVTPTRGIENSNAVAAREPGTAAVSGPEVNTTPTATGFTPRADRLAETLSADNAQARLPPQACVFVAKYVLDSPADLILTASSLSNQRTDEQLQHSCEQKFSTWGRCYAKIRRDKNKMPLAFVQFHIRAIYSS